MVKPVSYLRGGGILWMDPPFLFTILRLKKIYYVQTSKFSIIKKVTSNINYCNK